MKLLIYTHEFPPFLGGLATTSYKLAGGFCRAGIDVTVLAPGYGPDDREVDEGLGYSVKRVPAMGGKWVKLVSLLEILLGWLFLLLTLRSERPDVVLFITEEAEAVGGFLPFFSFIPVVRVAGSGITTCFYGNRPDKRLMRFPMKRLYRNSGLIIAVSRNTKGLIESIGVPAGKIEVIYNGVEVEMLSKKPEAERVSSLRERYGISTDANVLVTVARVVPRKGQDTVIRALPLVLEEFPNTVYMIVGEGRYKDRFEELAGETGVSEHVVFTGGVGHSEIVDYLDLADVFIMPNRYWNNKIEGLPNSLLEASAREKPVIAGNHGGSVEAVEHGVTGLLVDPENVRDVADAVLSLLREPEKARLMGEKGRKRVEECHTERGMIDNYVRAIAGLLPDGNNPMQGLD